jgi:hypothetical protein
MITSSLSKTGSVMGRQTASVSVRLRSIRDQPLRDRSRSIFAKHFVAVTRSSKPSLHEPFPSTTWRSGCISPQIPPSTSNPAFYLKSRLLPQHPTPGPSSHTSHFQVQHASVTARKRKRLHFVTSLSGGREGTSLRSEAENPSVTSHQLLGFAPRLDRLSSTGGLGCRAF